MRTICAEVRELNDAPAATAPNRIELVSSVLVGGAGACVMTKGCPAIVSVTVRAAQVGFGPTA
jgi:hypothetical protein